jgi:hypothetical protein
MRGASPVAARQGSGPGERPRVRFLHHWRPTAAAREQRRFPGGLLDFDSYSALVGLTAIRGGCFQATTGARVRSV